MKSQCPSRGTQWRQTLSLIKLAMTMWARWNFRHKCRAGIYTPGLNFALPSSANDLQIASGISQWKAMHVYSCCLLRKFFNHDMGSCRVRWRPKACLNESAHVQLKHCYTYSYGEHPRRLSTVEEPSRWVTLSFTGRA